VNYRSMMAALAAAAVLAGCSQANAPAPPPPGNAQETVVLTKRCPSGNVRVRPCSLKFTAKNRGPDTVAVRYTETKSGSLSESDTCGGTSGIAWLEPTRDGVEGKLNKVRPADGEGWYVYSGSETGSCVATFKYKNVQGKSLGQAKLKIINTL
jgi:hypothetical protein